jgi:hypothetical protein
MSVAQRSSPPPSVPKKLVWSCAKQRKPPRPLFVSLCITHPEKENRRSPARLWEDRTGFANTPATGHIHNSTLSSRARLRGLRTGTLSIGERPLTKEVIEAVLEDLDGAFPKDTLCSSGLADGPDAGSQPSSPLEAASCWLEASDESRANLTAGRTTTRVGSSIDSSSSCSLSSSLTP